MSLQLPNPCHSHLLRVVVVCHCYRGDDNVIRIISARKATTQELKAY